jgi:2',3'-cyclic-nucleotide 2'-phosphodiesterase (5'-nucleotidase family)
MINLKNCDGKIKHFVLFITTFILVACTSQKNYVATIEGKNIPVNALYSEVKPINDFITPYRDYINKDLDNVLAYNPETLDKSQGEWQTNIGNFLADVCIQEGNKVFEKKESKKIDFCILNHGGIRSIIPKGNVTTRTAFEVMPFENNLFVVQLKGEQVIEMAHYLAEEKKPHPLSGIEIYFSKNLDVQKILIQGKPLIKEKNYYVATSDYLLNGGDKMNFFLKNKGNYDLDYKIRNILIDYFKQVDTLKAAENKRIIVE